MGMDLTFPWYLYLIVLAGALLVYLLISSILTGKIRKIVPAEVLKNRE
jgi:putative ABC transport system permease protein